MTKPGHSQRGRDNNGLFSLKRGGVEVDGPIRTTMVLLRVFVVGVNGAVAVECVCETGRRGKLRVKAGIAVDALVPWAVRAARSIS